MTLATSRTTLTVDGQEWEGRCVLLTVEIPMHPPRECSPNWYGPWRKKAKAVAELRETAWKAALEAKNDFCYLTYEAVFDAVPVAIHAVIHWGKGRKTMDDTNAASALKAAIDGLQDADIFGNDKQVRQLTVEQQRAADGIGRITLTVSEMDE
jgi:hypothetical protein